MNGDINRDVKQDDRGSGGTSLLLSALAIIVVLTTVYFASQDRQQSPLLTAGKDLAVPSPMMRDK
jgi:hypothetical protein